MIVVSDTSPIIVMTDIGHSDVLASLFGGIIVPPEVLTELAAANKSKAVRDLAGGPPQWFAVRAATRIEDDADLHAGEKAAIGLAGELGADLLLIDERDGRAAAVGRGLRIAGTVGVLEAAADRGLLDLADAFDRVKRTDFWVSPRFLDQRLALHQRRR